jgi:hypothetical protein
MSSATREPIGLVAPLPSELQMFSRESTLSVEDIGVNRRERPDIVVVIRADSDKIVPPRQIAADGEHRRGMMPPDTIGR